MNNLTEEAWELIHKAPYVVNKLAERINKVIDDVAEGKDDNIQGEIAHVGYNDEQLGREK